MVPVQRARHISPAVDSRPAVVVDRIAPVAVAVAGIRSAAVGSIVPVVAGSLVAVGILAGHMPVDFLHQSRLHVPSFLLYNRFNLSVLQSK